MSMDRPHPRPKRQRRNTPAPPGIRSNLTLPPRTAPELDYLARAGINFAEVSKGEYRVAERFLFWPGNGFWRAIDGSRQGYTARKLAEAVAA